MVTRETGGYKQFIVSCNHEIGRAVALAKEAIISKDYERARQFLREAYVTAFDKYQADISMRNHILEMSISEISEDAGEYLTSEDARECLKSCADVFQKLARKERKTLRDLEELEFLAAQRINKQGEE